MTRWNSQWGGLYTAKEPSTPRETSVNAADLWNSHIGKEPSTPRITPNPPSSASIQPPPYTTIEFSTFPQDPSNQPDLEAGPGPSPSRPRRNYEFDNYLTRDFRDVALDHLDYESQTRPKKKNWKLFVIGAMVVGGLIAVAVTAVEIAQGQQNAAAEAQMEGTPTGREQTSGVQENGTQTQTATSTWDELYPTANV